MAAKNIALCSDGTGNAGGKGRGTNVWQVFLAVDQHGHETDSKLTEQLAFYDDGVGTSTARWKALPGKAFGVGLSANIRELYTALVRNYDDGDQLYLFGFSRGAFTIRSLAGMIAEVGVIDRRRSGDEGGPLTEAELEEAVAAAYRAYRHQMGYKPDQFWEWCGQQGIEVYTPEIQFLGVWDTVSAIGVPFTGLRRVVQALAFARRPHVHDLNHKLVHACHALAIDETRLSFKLEMFDESQAEEDWSLESVDQVWFAGVHSNVGGGYPKKGMENVALHWMMTHAANRGLRLSAAASEAAQRRANVHSELYDSRKGLALYYRYRARDVAELSQEGRTEAKVHVTALDRIRRATRGYAPINLPASFEVVGTGNGEEELRKAGLGTQKDEDRRIADFTDRLEANRGMLEDLAEPGRKLNKRREVLYYFFLALSAVLLVILLSQQAVEKKILLDWSGSIAGFFQQQSDHLDPILGWSEPVLGFVGGAADLLLPDMLAGPVRGFAEKLPELTLLFVIVGWILMRIRRSLVDKSQHLGGETWRGILG